MEFLEHLGFGFSVALTPMNLAYCFAGALLGTLIGVLPGIGPVATIAMLLPATYALAPTSALIMLAGIYYGAQYGGSTTAILVNMPGESASVMTCLDGYEMTRQGKAGAALATAALASFFAGTVATIAVAALSPPLTKLALSFGAAEYCSLMLLGLIGAVAIAHGSLLKALAMIVSGMILGIVGTDVHSGVQRFTFGFPELADGIGVVVVAMGLFGFAEIFRNLETMQQRQVVVSKVTGLWLNGRQFMEAAPAAVRGTMLGSILGLLPGGGATMSSFASYALEKSISKTPEEFGKGSIKGVAGPEAANNAGAQTSFIPLLTLGIPENAVMALMIGAMMIHNIQPGPRVMISNPDLFWGLIASMWLGNLMLVVLNLPLIGIWTRLLKVPYRVLYPAILLFCAIGVFSVNNASFDILLLVVFGLLGILFYKIQCEPAPLLLGFVLGPMMEDNLRRALVLARGDWSVFVVRPISGALLAIALAVICLVLLPSFRRTRERLKEE